MARNQSEKFPKAPEHWDPIVEDIALRLAQESVANGFTALQMREGKSWNPYTTKTDRWYSFTLGSHGHNLWGQTGMGEKREFMADVMEFLDAEKQK